MSNTNKPEKKQCSRHIFSLKPKSQTCFYQQPITIKFCDESLGKAKNSTTNQNQCYEGPIFNSDKNFLTSSFIINSQKKKYMPSENKAVVDNQNKYQNFNDEKSEMLQPKPNSKNMYCNVCKEKYDDYREHVLLEKHKKRIRSSCFNDYIIEFESKYNTLRSNFKLKEKEKQLITLEASNVIVIDQSSIQEIELSKPKKKFKLDLDIKQERTVVNTTSNRSSRIHKTNISNNQILPQPRAYCLNMLPMPVAYQYPVIYSDPLGNPYNLDLNAYYTIQSQFHNYLKYMMTTTGYTCCPPYTEDHRNKQTHPIVQTTSPAYTTINIDN